MKKSSKKLSALVAAMVCPLITGMPVHASELITTNQLGTHEGYDFEFWMDKGDGDGSMTLNEAGAFSCQWQNAQNILFRTGKKFNETKTHEELGEIKLNYSADYRPVGNSYLCVYGWTVDPLMEYYIVESWGTWKPPGGASVDTVEIDGRIYDIYETTRTEMPSIRGTQTFQQYWSVGRNRQTEGTISVSEHMKAWEKLGMKMGKMYEVAFCVEGYQSSGEADIHTNVIEIDGIDVALLDESGDQVKPDSSVQDDEGNLLVKVGLPVLAVAVFILGFILGRRKKNRRKPVEKGI